MEHQVKEPVSKPKQKQKNAIVNGYLIMYNFIQALGWSALLFFMALHFAEKETNKGMYQATKTLLKIFQTAALLEVVHPMLGLVKTNIFLTFLQVLSRVLLVWAVTHTFPEVQDHIGYTMFTLAWTLTEIVRYSFYTFSLMDEEVPYLLKWGRYTLFIVLYPIGVTGELLCIVSALPYARKSGIYSIDLPNPANMSFSYYYMMILGLMAYIPSFPMLYKHMLMQRKKVLGGHVKQE